MTYNSRHLRFSLRALLIAVTVTAIYVGWHANRVHTQRAAATRVLQAGGTVEYAHHYEAIHNDSWVQHPGARPPGPAWLRHILGDDYFTSVISVNLNDATVESIDDVLPAVGDLTSLRFLDMQNQGVTDDGLAHIQALTLLEELHINGTDITDAGMSHLEALDNLVDLSIDGTSVSDVGFGNARIENKRRLRYLSMIATQVSDDSLSRLEHIPNLSLVTCAFTNVTPEAVDRYNESRPDVKVICRYDEPFPDSFAEGDPSGADPFGVGLSVDDQPFRDNRDPFAVKTGK